MAADQAMHSWASRLNTFQIAHQLSKRRASSQQSKKKGAGNTVEWPHEHPSAEELARAGFFYRPTFDSIDNVQCFLCEVKLDGWEPEDDPLKEHIAHSVTCQWATTLHAGHSAQQDDQDQQDPMQDELVEARKGTFQAGNGWPHEGKRGWKCKINKMVEAGWCLDPAASGEDEDGDGVTCFYCNLSLDGWEPKDDPLEEHKRRSPECAFFALVEKFGSAVGKKGKGRGKKAGGGRGSTASKASRLSTQSALSTFSEVPSFADVGPNEAESGADDSIMSTATTASQATMTGGKGKKKGARAKAAAKGAKGRKRANTVDSEVEPDQMYPDLSAHMASQATQEEAISVLTEAALTEEPAPPAKKPRKGTRASKQALDSSAIDASSAGAVPAKKGTRGRKAETPQDPDSDHTEISAQLQEELERSMSFGAGDVEDEATPQPQPAKSKRGVKRTSEGLRKEQDEDVSAVIIEFPVPPKPAPAAKGKKGRNPSKQVAAEGDVDIATQPLPSKQEDVAMSEAEIEPVKPARTAKAPAAKGKGKAKKTSSARSSRSSKATITADSEPVQDEPEDLERDEREIEAELERMAADHSAHQAVEIEQDHAAEFEPSPSHAQKHVQQIQQLEQELQAEVDGMEKPGRNMANYVAAVAASPPRHVAIVGNDNATPSPSGSDKENQPSSIVQPSAKQHKPAAAAPVPVLSPTKPTRMPLAPGTPNQRTSPSKRGGNLILSPAKNLSKLTSTQPWESVDLDTILLASPQPTPGTLSQRLAGAAGALTSPEKGLTVEGWVRWRAEKSDEELRRRCEEMVSLFETAGNRAVGAVGGIVVQ